MKEIPLTQGMVAQVSDQDYEELNRDKWHARKGKLTYYASRNIKGEDGKYTTIRMHEQILGKKPGFQVDHRDGDGLNNQRYNLRHATSRQNAQNRHYKKSSAYPGVSWDSQRHKWSAYIRIDGKRKYLGRYQVEFEAFKKYCKALEGIGEPYVAV